MAIKTLEIKELESKAKNVYEAIVVLSKRARQLNDETKLDFQQRIENIVALPSSPDEVEDAVNPDQMRISLEFEKRPKVTEEAIDELMSDQLEHRYKEADEKK